MLIPIYLSIHLFSYRSIYLVLIFFEFSFFLCQLDPVYSFFYLFFCLPDIGGEVGTSWKVMYSCGPIHMDEQSQYDHLKPTYSSGIDTVSGPEDLPEAIHDKDGWRERVRDIHVIARHDDDDDDATLLN